MTSDDVVQIQQLVYREREARDRHWWDEMRQVYSEDAFINISWYCGDAKGFIENSMVMAQKSVSNHRLRPVVVRVNQNRAIATLSAAIESRLELHGVEADLDSQARLVYKALKLDHGWKLVSLECIYQRDTLAPSIFGLQLTLDLNRLKAYRSPYRCLSYVLESKGYPVNQELPGDDRPVQVQEIYDKAFSWLSSTEAVNGH